MEKANGERMCETCGDVVITKIYTWYIYIFFNSRLFLRNCAFPSSGGRFIAITRGSRFIFPVVICSPVTYVSVRGASSIPSKQSTGSDGVMSALRRRHLKPSVECFFVFFFSYLLNPTFCRWSQLITCDVVIPIPPKCGGRFANPAGD